MTPTEQDKELRALLGEMPNFVIDWLELSDDLRNEWKKGGKASDFGGHRTFIQKYEKKLANLITAYLQAYTDEIRSEVIGDGEVHISHLCPPDNVGCAKFAARGQMRHEQRQALNNLANKWGVK